MRLTAALLFSLFATAASAQQQATPSQVAIQIDNVVNGMAQSIENDQRIIADLQKQIADLKAKYEPAKSEPKK